MFTVLRLHTKPSVVFTDSGGNCTISTGHASCAIV